MKETESPFQTEGHVQKMRAMREANSRSLFPSQAWAMFRILPKGKTMLDAGFGSVNSLHIARSINPDIGYTGLEFVPQLVEDAKPFEDDRTRFICSDFNDWTDYRPGEVDIAQAWSFVYAFADLYGTARKLWDICGRYCVFDIRANHLEYDVGKDWETLSYGVLEGRKGPMNVIGWNSFKRFVETLSPRPEAVEFSCYYHPFHHSIHYDERLPLPFIASIVLEKGAVDVKKTEWFGRVPPPI